ncbi:uncharacterized protein LOC133737271 [Rosa rugosa]|uniref:uncharacterized protein LOC133737271 n=1 Tax=Rosa rugosa TaxID=74645 RepID=UPI002B40B9B2|nr:uncharacterized protein LOC133737271 [Rosa rugosa]
MDYDLPEEGIEAFHSLYERLSSYLVEKEAYDRVATVEIVNEEFSDQEQEDEEEIQLAPAALDDTPPKVRDPTEKVNLGTLPTLPDKRPVKQEPWRMNFETQVLVKEEVEKMHKSGIIRVAKYNQWLSNIVPVRKKNGKMKVFVDYRDLNVATPKDVYPIPVADMLRAMNLIFHDIHGKILEVYIDDVVVKSKKRGDHIVDLKKVFERMRQLKLKMNPAKCVFRVQAGDFLGFIVHQRGKIQPFSPLLKLQGQNEFVWEPKHQEVFDNIKAYLASPPVLVPPRAGFPLKLYISAAEASIGSLLAQDDEEGVEHAIFYLSRTLTDCETSMQIATLHVILYHLHHCSNRPGQVYALAAYFKRSYGKWVLALSEFSLQYVPEKAVKGQTIADFLAHQPMLDVPMVRELEVATAIMTRPDLACIPEYAMLYQATVSLQPWVLYFDGSRTETLAGAGVVLENPAGDRFSYSFQLEFRCTNNQAEYEALIIGLEVLLELGVRDIQVRGDSLFVINQLREKYRCASCLLVPYLNHAVELLDQFDDVDLEYIHRERNFAANELAQLAAGITLKYGVRERILKVERRTLPLWLARPDLLDDPVVAVLEPIDIDWRIPLIDYLKQPDPTADRKIRFLALNYFIRGDELR